MIQRINCDYFQSFLNPVLIASVLFVLWTLLGIFFYTFYNGWSFSTSFYYAMEAGLSIGFCYPSEATDWSKLFTTFYVLLGSSVVFASLRVFIVHFTNSRVRLTGRSRRHTYYEREDINWFQYSWFYLKDKIGWYSNRSRAKILIAFVIWMSLGIAYGMSVEKYTFITALYWSITSAATDGLQTAPCQNGYPDLNGHCEMGVMRGTVMGIWFAVAVPLYAATMAMFADIFMRRAIERKIHTRLNTPIEFDEFLFAANLLSTPGSQSVQTGEFILLYLMLLGQTDADEIQKYKDEFLALTEGDREANLSMKFFVRESEKIRGRVIQHRSSLSIMLDSVRGELPSEEGPPGWWNRLRGVKRPASAESHRGRGNSNDIEEFAPPSSPSLSPSPQKKRRPTHSGVAPLRLNTEREKQFEREKERRRSRTEPASDPPSNLDPLPPTPSSSSFPFSPSFFLSPSIKAKRSASSQNLFSFYPSPASDLPSSPSNNRFLFSSPLDREGDLEAGNTSSEKRGQRQGGIELWSPPKGSSFKDISPSPSPSSSLTPVRKLKKSVSFDDSIALESIQTSRETERPLKRDHHAPLSLSLSPSLSPPTTTNTPDSSSDSMDSSSEKKQEGGEMGRVGTERIESTLNENRTMEEEGKESGCELDGEDGIVRRIDF